MAAVLSRPPSPGRLASLPAFLAKLQDSGLLSGEDLAIERAAAERCGDVEAFAGRMVSAGRLTAYQANELMHGRSSGFVLGNYIIQKSLGEGGMGKVFLARHRRMKREVALKVLPPARARDPEAARRFACEVEALARLHHPNIAAAFDADEAKGVHFLALEFVAGRDLARELKARGALPVAEAAAAVAQAARGLAYAHRQGVIHRDVKPHNLMRGPDGVVKILDMGLARLALAAEPVPDGAAAGPTATTHGATLAGRVLGTPDYISPEQAAGEPLDSRCDLYSLGCTLFHLVAGRPPFPQQTLAGKLLAHGLDPAPALTDVVPGVPPRLSALCLRMMAKRAEDRPANADLVAEELEGLAAEARAPAPPRPPAASEADEFARMLREDRSLASVLPGSSASLGGGKPWPRGAKPFAVAAAALAAAALAGMLALAALRPGAPSNAVAAPAAGPADARATLAAALRRLAADNPGYASRLDPAAPPPHEAAFDGPRLDLLRLPANRLRNLAALAELPPLRRLELVPQDDNKGQLEDLAALAGVKLRELSLAGNPQVRDLRPLAGLDLADLDLTDTRAIDLAPLAGKALRRLRICRTAVFDLAPLAGMASLRELALCGTPVEDLAPLAGIPLTRFEARGAPIAFLQPVLQPALRHVDVAECRLLKDAERLAATAVETLHADLPRWKVPLVERSMPQLRLLNGVPVRR